MKWILLWMFLTPAGVVSTGSAEFDDKASCISAGDSFRGTIMATAKKRTGVQDMVHEFHCEPKGAVAPQSPTSGHMKN